MRFKKNDCKNQNNLPFYLLSNEYKLLFLTNITKKVPYSKLVTLKKVRTSKTENLKQYYSDL